MGTTHRCQGVHFWVPGGWTERNERPVSCHEYVTLLEQTLRELAGTPDAPERMILRWLHSQGLSEGGQTASNTAEYTCSRCRANPPRPSGRFCHGCFEALASEAGVSQDD